MQDILRKLSVLLALLSIICLMIYGSLVYFVRSQDPSTGTITDGLGREMELPPFFIRKILGWAELWAGFWPFVLDTVILFGLIGLVFLFCTLGSSSDKVKLSSTSKKGEKNRGKDTGNYLWLKGLLWSIPFVVLVMVIAAESDKETKDKNQDITLEEDDTLRKLTMDEFKDIRSNWLAFGDSHCQGLSQGAHCWVNVDSTYDPKKGLIRHFREMRANGVLKTVGELTEKETSVVLRTMYYFGAAQIACKFDFDEYDLTFEENLKFKEDTLTFVFHVSECGEEINAKQAEYLERVARRVGETELFRWMIELEESAVN